LFRNKEYQEKGFFLSGAFGIKRSLASIINGVEQACYPTVGMSRNDCSAVGRKGGMKRNNKPLG